MSVRAHSEECRARMEALLAEQGNPRYQRAYEGRKECDKDDREKTGKRISKERGRRGRED